MADLNYCVFIGRVGRDPEMRYLPNGDAACNASIAVSKRWKDKTSGEMKEQTTWVPLSMFGKTAELFCQYAKKGSQIRVNGEFSVRKYTDKDGNEKTSTEIRVQDFQLLGAKPEGGGSAPAPAPAPAPRPAPRQQSSADFDDAPF